MLVSVIIPVFNEEKILRPLFEKIKAVLSGDKSTDYEIVFIDDCSRDSSFSILEGLSREDSPFPVRIIKLARNVGTHIGLQAGMRYCRGDAAVIIAADMQCPLEAIPELVARHREGFPVVWAIRTERRESIWNRMFARCYYLLLKMLVKQELHYFDIESFLVNRQIMNQMKDIREKNSNILLLIMSLGFKQGLIGVKRLERTTGRSGWTLSRKIKLLVDSLVSFSYLPIRLISYLGIFISLSGFILAGFQIYDKLSGVQKPMGWTSLIVLILILSGIQMLILGVLGEYLWRAFDQLSSKPYYVIDRLVGFEEKEKDR